MIHKGSAKIGALGRGRTFHLSMSSVSHGLSTLWVDGIVAAAYRVVRLAGRRKEGTSALGKDECVRAVGGCGVGGG